MSPSTEPLTASGASTLAASLEKANAEMGEVCEFSTGKNTTLGVLYIESATCPFKNPTSAPPLRNRQRQNKLKKETS